MRDVMHIPDHVLEEIGAQARAALPNECCGLLIGAGLTVHRAHPAKNLEPTPTRYVVDPADHFAAIRSARAEGLSVIGAYHSHPGAAPVPSRRDRADALFPDFVYLIVSAGEEEGPEFRAYRLAADDATPVEIARVSDRTEIRR